MAEGWIKLHRKLADNKMWLSEPFTRAQAWVDMLLLANHQPGFIRVQGLRIDLERGDMAWSEVNLAQRWKWSRGKVRRFFAELKKDFMIESKLYEKTDKRKSVVTILNYEAYQTDGTSDGTGDGTSDGQATVQEQECKECKEEKIKDIVGQPTAQPDLPPPPPPPAPTQNGVPVAAIVQMLNEKAGTQFKATTDSTKKHIKARFAEKFTLEDFRTVIDHKVSEWGTDAKMREFLRPQTLFGTKFESYLQAAKMAPVENEWGIYGKWKDQPQHN